MNLHKCNYFNNFQLKIPLHKILIPLFPITFKA